ncbi:MAG: AMP-binding protein [Actinomycetia bacterium]|nr:AMP-binding protein [Actinomycetes bacterium]
MILGKSLAHTATLHPDRPAVIFDEQVWSHRELQERVYRLANALSALGYAKGDRIAVLGRNSHRYLEISLALGLTGIVMVPINHRLLPAEVATRLDHAGVTGLLVEPEFFDLSREAATASLARSPTIVMDDEQTLGALNYESLLQNGEPRPPSTTVDPEDALYLGYTSGTTGQAKAAIVSHRAIVVGFLYKALQYQIGTNQTTLNPGFYWHSAPRDFALLQIYLGGTAVVMREFEPRRCLELIQTHQVSNGFFVPTMLQLMMELPDFAAFDVRSLQVLLSGGAPLPTSIKTAALERFGPIIHEFYAATETRIVTSITPQELEVKTRSVGRPVRDVDVRILDDAGSEVPLNEVGEIYLKTPTLFSGYHNDPDKTAAAFRDSWFSLGDMGRQDADGYVYLVDRRHDMIISGGENIYPSEIEDVLLRHPAVADVAVIGVPHEKWGEAVKAVVVLHDGQHGSADELTASCAEHLADYLKPRSYDFVDELPRNPTGKVLKRVLRDPYWHDREVNL